jgi:hypothetical protein
MLGLLNRDVTPLEEEDLGLVGLRTLRPWAWVAPTLPRLSPPLSSGGQSACYLQQGITLL